MEQLIPQIRTTFYDINNLAYIFIIYELIILILKSLYTVHRLLDIMMFY